MITCKDLVGFLVDYLEGDLPPEIRMALERHLEGCECCHAFLNTYKKAVSTLRAMKEEEFPAELKLRLHSFLRENVRGAFDKDDEGR